MLVLTDASYRIVHIHWSLSINRLKGLHFIDFGSLLNERPIGLRLYPFAVP